MGKSLIILLLSTGIACAQTSALKYTPATGTIVPALNSTQKTGVATSFGLLIGTNVQAYDADLTTYAGITPSANVQTFLGAADYAAMKTQLSLTIGTNVQAYDADLSLWAAITPTNGINGTMIAMGSDASGDVLYYDGTNYVRLAKGADGTVLKLASGIPAWGTDDTAGSPVWDSLGDATGDGSVAFGGTTQDITANTNDVTAIAQDVLRLTITNDAGTDVLTQRLLVLRNASATGGTTEALLALENQDNSTLTAGITIAGTSTGAITTAIDVSDAEIGTALAIGSNDVTVGGVTISSAEFANLDGTTLQTTAGLEAAVEALTLDLGTLNVTTLNATTFATTVLQAGSSGVAGSIVLGNATSGLLTMTVGSGALGTKSLIIPSGAPTGDTLAVLGFAQVFTDTQSVQSTSATAFTVGRNGATTPAFQVDDSTAASITGIKIKSGATGGGVAISAIGEAANGALTIDAQGSGTITLGGTSTGAITLTRATTLSAALTYGGVTLSNAVTGTGNMVLATSPAFTTKITLPTAAGSSTLTTSGDTAYDTTKQKLGIYNGTKEVAISTIYHSQWSFDPKAVCDGAVDRLFLMSTGTSEPFGIHVTAWKLSFEADPTTEVDLDLKRADAFIGVANSAVMDVLDTTAGVSSETSSANINGDAVVANAKVLYLEFGTAYTETTHQIIFEMWWEIEED